MIAWPPPSRWLTTVFLGGVCTILTITATAQSLGFFREQDQTQREDAPTVITSDTLDIDIANDLATFTGNVVVDDQEMHISCNKLLVYLTAVTEPASAEPTTTEPTVAKPVTPEPAVAGQPRGNKRVSRIVCIGDVIIVRKLIDAGDNERIEQKALAGRAEYNIDSGQIVLTEEPVLMRGTDSLRGERITIWRDSDKMKVEGGSKLEMKTGAINQPPDPSGGTP